MKIHHERCDFVESGRRVIRTPFSCWYVSVEDDGGRKRSHVVSVDGLRWDQVLGLSKC